MLAVDEDEDEEENEMDKRTAGRKAETGKSFPAPELHPIFAITNSLLTTPFYQKTHH